MQYEKECAGTVGNITVMRYQKCAGTVRNVGRLLALSSMPLRQLGSGIVIVIHKDVPLTWRWSGALPSP